MLIFFFFPVLVVDALSFPWLYRNIFKRMRHLPSLRIRVPGYGECKLMFAKDSLLRSTGSRVAPQGRSTLVYIGRWIIWYDFKI